MNEKDFTELLESVQEVGLAEKGLGPAGREFVVEKKIDIGAGSIKTFAICLSNEDEDLIPFKIYPVLLQPELKTCTVKDENQQTSVCPMDWFLPIEFPSKIERLLEEKELALD